MPIRVRANFTWRKDDADFVDGLLDELREIASSLTHRSQSNRLDTKVLHRLELRASPVSVEACLGLLAGVAEAGARLTIELEPGTD